MKRRRTLMIALAVLAAAAALGWWHFGGHRTPEGQPPLADVSQLTLEGFRREFNAASGDTRLIVLLSPTCSVCLQGTSTVQRILERHPGMRIRVYTVWEPILPTDFMRPLTFVLARLSDRRVRQFWDNRHQVALRMAADAKPPQPAPDCCDQDGVLWDMVAVYPPGAVWGDRLPPAVFFNGIVVDVAEALEETLVKLQEAGRASQ